MPDVQARRQDAQLRGIGDVAAAQLDDHVAPLQPAGLGRAAGLHPGDEDAAVVGQLELLGRLGCQGLDDARPGSPERPSLP